MSKHLTPRYQFRQKWGDFTAQWLGHLISDGGPDYDYAPKASAELPPRAQARCAAAGGQMQILINKTNIQQPAAATVPSLCRPQHEYYN